MPRIRNSHSPRYCPKTGKPLDRSTPHPRRRWLIWLYPVLGLISLVWFLLRVVPKPSRAGYPCQRAAAPLAASFIAWAAGVLASIVAFHRARSLLRRSRYVVAAVAILVGCVALYIAGTNTPGESAQAYTYEPCPPTFEVNDPIGDAKGLFPGRVVWVHDPDATEWDEPDRYDDFHDRYWWEDGNTDQAVVDAMVAKSVRCLTEADTNAAAWDLLFRHFNTSRGLDDEGYQAGDKIAIKINLTVVNHGGYNSVDNEGWQVSNLWSNSASMEMIHSLLDQLVNEANVPEADISIGDPTCYFPSREYEYLSASFPGVNYMSARDGKSLPGRPKTASSSVKMEWSTSAAAGRTQDYLPQYYVNAKYFINLAILKAHGAAVTLCGKNHYGSLNRRPDAGGYFNLHPSIASGSPSYGSYRALVDLMGHDHIGGKTLLYIIDGLWGGYSWGNVCPPVKWRMDPFSGDHPNSVFMSQDPVAIDSVGFDFLFREDCVSGAYYPYNGYKDAYGYGSTVPHMARLSGGVDYLIEAAMADGPTSGTFYDPEGDGTRMASLGVYEHWNNPADKQYSRNLGTGDGIELVTDLPRTEVVARHVFYNNSVFDDSDAAPGPPDDAAIAPDKVALMMGETATFANYTNYSRGLNGVMIDIRGLAGTPTAADFDFRTSTDGASWIAAPTPTVTVRPGEGIGGSSRITLTWPDQAITNCWLRIITFATPATGLIGYDMFHFGNLIGETGDSGDDPWVTPIDMDNVKNNPAGLTLDHFVTLKQNFGTETGAACADGDYDGDGDVDLDDFVILKQCFGAPALIDNPYDMDRDGCVDCVDVEIVEANLGRSLPLISP